MNKLTNTEQFAFDLIKDDIIFFVDHNLKTLANKYAVGEATLIRLIKKLGYKTLKEMQLNYVPKTEINSLMQIKDESERSSIIDNVASYEIYSILETKNLINEKEINQAVDLIINACHINIFGIENSNISALFLKSKLERIGFNCTVSQSIHGAITQLQFFDSQDLIIIYSVSGMTKECLQLAKLALDKQIKFIWIGSIKAINKQTILNQATVKIFHPLHHNEPLRFPQISASSSQLFISNLLFNLILSYDKEILENLKIADGLVKEWNQ